MCVKLVYQLYHFSGVTGLAGWLGQLRGEGTKWLLDRARMGSVFSLFIQTLSLQRMGPFDGRDIWFTCGWFGID